MSQPKKKGTAQFTTGSAAIHAKTCNNRERVNDRCYLYGG